MAGHEEFLELCATATAGELTPGEQAKLDRHLALCPDCRRAMGEYELAAALGAAALASERDPEENPPAGSVASSGRGLALLDSSKARWQEAGMAVAGVAILLLALGIADYRSGPGQRARIQNRAPEPSPASLEAQLSDLGHERSELLAKLNRQERLIARLRGRFSAQARTMAALKASQNLPGTEGSELSESQDKLLALQKKIDSLTRERDVLTAQAAVLETQAGQLGRLVRDREQELDNEQALVGRQQKLLEHDRDIRELMGARDLSIAEVHDVNGQGESSSSYGRVFYTRGKRLVFYAYDLDAQSGIRNAATFQAWGRRALRQDLSLGIFFEDNAGKKRWVLKSTDPESIKDLDAVFVTVEPEGGSPRPSGKPLLFAYLRANPNHP